MPRRSAAAPRPKAPAARAPQRHAPPPQQHAPPPAPASSAHAPPPAMPQQASGGGGFLSGLMGSVAQGAALGTGSAIAHRAVDSMMGPRGHAEAAPAAPEAYAAPAAYGAPASSEAGPCSQQAKAFAECMSSANGDMAACQFYFEAMQQCKVGQPFA